MTPRQEQKQESGISEHFRASAPLVRIKHKILSEQTMTTAGLFRPKHTTAVQEKANFCAANTLKLSA